MPQSIRAPASAHGTVIIARQIQGVPGWVQLCVGKLLAGQGPGWWAFTNAWPEQPTWSHRKGWRPNSMTYSMTPQDQMSDAGLLAESLPLPAACSISGAANSALGP